MRSGMVLHRRSGQIGSSCLQEAWMAKLAQYHAWIHQPGYSVHYWHGGEGGEGEGSVGDASGGGIVEGVVRVR